MYDILLYLYLNIYDIHKQERNLCTFTLLLFLHLGMPCFFLLKVDLEWNVALLFLHISNRFPKQLHSIIQYFNISFYILCPGVFLWRFCFCARDRRNPVAEGRWKEVMEEALLPSQSLGNLLCPQRQSQGSWAGWTKWRHRPRLSICRTGSIWYFLFKCNRHSTCFYLTRELLCSILAPSSKVIFRLSP